MGSGIVKSKWAFLFIGKRKYGRLEDWGVLEREERRGVGWGEVKEERNI
jgi:hypothetical protein